MRSEIERRPFVIACAALIIGLTLARHPVNLLFLIPFPFILTKLRGRTVATLALLVGALLGPGRPSPLLEQSEYVDSNWQIAGLPRIASYGQKCEISNGRARLQLTYTGSEHLCPGDLVHLRGVAQPPSEGAEAYFQSRGLLGRFTADHNALSVVGRGPWLQRISCEWRNRFLEFTASNLPEREAVATAALCFNADGMLDDSTREAMQRTGTTHIIAASGLQVVVVAQGLLWMLMLLPLPRSLQLGVAGALLALYVFATGLNPPVVRAALMWLIANYAYLVRREPDWFSALGASSLFYLIWRPGAVYEMGFQFSVAAVLFLAMFGSHEKWRPGLVALVERGIRKTVKASAIAFLVVSPMIAYHFGILSLVSIPANLLIVVAVGPVVIGAMAAYGISMLSPAVGGFILAATGPFTAYIEWVLHSLNGPFAAVQVPPFDAYWLVPFYLCLLALWKPHVRTP